MLQLRGETGRPLPTRQSPSDAHRGNEEVGADEDTFQEHRRRHKDEQQSAENMPGRKMILS